MAHNKTQGLLLLGLKMSFLAEFLWKEAGNSCHYSIFQILLPFVFYEDSYHLLVYTSNWWKSLMKQTSKFPHQEQIMWKVQFAESHFCGSFCIGTDVCVEQQRNIYPVSRSMTVFCRAFTSQSVQSLQIQI